MKIIEKITKKENRETVKKEDSNKKFLEVENIEYSDIDSSDTLKTKVNELEKQIEIFETRAKNDENYISNLTKQLDQQNSNVNTLNKLLENQQILALESNKKIQKLEHQLEEERQIKYTFDTTINDRQNNNVQEAAITEESQNMNQQQEETEMECKDIPKEKKGESINEELISQDDKKEESPKKGFWRRFLCRKNESGKYII
ncbi:DUF536 domain-containing protein [Staphylococcus xylosus]|nr:DUF536 domain-containing protein [Staphylococcus xylosus]MEB7866401.1 DUF536 domain-containing protein [Staphylococcus xylosus]